MGDEYGKAVSSATSKKAALGADRRADAWRHAGNPGNSISYVGRWLGHDQPGDELGAFLGMHFKDSDLIGGEGDLSWNRGRQRQGYVAAVDVDRLGDVANGVHLHPLADSHLHVDTRGADRAAGDHDRHRDIGTDGGGRRSG